MPLGAALAAGTAESAGVRGVFFAGGIVCSVALVVTLRVVFQGVSQDRRARQDL